MAKGLPNSHKHIRNGQSSLRFGEDGKFRILHLTDIHEVDPEMDDDENRSIPINKSAETGNVIRRWFESMHQTFHATRLPSEERIGRL